MATGAGREGSGRNHRGHLSGAGVSPAALCQLLGPVAAEDQEDYRCGAMREAAVDVEMTTGTKVHAFTSGTMVQIFQLVRSAPADIWNRN